MATGDVLRNDLNVGQLPYREDDDWAGIDAQDGSPAPPSDGTVSMVSYFASTYDGQSEPIAKSPGGDGDENGSRVVGLYVDDWRVAIPSTSETTGIAVNYDDPGVEPPQSILLGVPPERHLREGAETRDPPDHKDLPPWTEETLLRTILEGIDLAKMRGVDLDAIGQATESTQAADGILGHMFPALLFPHNTKHRPDVPSAKFRLDADLPEHLLSLMIPAESMVVDPDAGQDSSGGTEESNGQEGED